MVLGHTKDLVTIGIIIPAYNAATTLTITLNAVANLKSSNNQFNFYCVLIDDGSTDNTELIVTPYIQHSVIDCYIKNAHNCGISAARNTGIKQCRQTDYITFCDADDELLLEGFTNCDIHEDDLILFNHFRQDQHEKKLIAYEFNPTTDSLNITTQLQYLNRYLERPNKYHLWTSCWAKLFNTNIITTNNLQFDESMNVFEDVKFNFEFLIHAHNIRYINAALYCHLLPNDQQLTNSATMGAHCTISERFTFVAALNPALKFLNKFTNESERSLNKAKVFHCIGAYTMITIIRSCLKLDSFTTFLAVRKQILIVLSSQKINQALHNYSPAVANGNSILPWLIKKHLLSIALIYAHYLARKRYL